MNAAAQTSLKPLIHFEQVTKSFKGRVVLKDLSIDLQVGQCHLLLGDNGAGKSTLLRAINILHQLFVLPSYFRLHERHAVS